MEILGFQHVTHRAHINLEGGSVDLTLPDVRRVHRGADGVRRGVDGARDLLGREVLLVVGLAVERGAQADEGGSNDLSEGRDGKAVPIIIVKLDERLERLEGFLRPAAGSEGGGHVGFHHLRGRDGQLNEEGVVLADHDP